MPINELIGGLGAGRSRGRLREKIRPPRVIPRARPRPVAASRLIPKGERVNMDIILGVDNGRPNDQREFFHKKLFGGLAKKVIGIGVPLAKKFFGGGGGRGRQPPREELFFPTSIPRTFVPTVPVESVIPGGERIAGNGRCSPGTIRDRTGLCVAPGSPFGAGRLEGDVLMGRFGPAVAADEVLRSIAMCPTGMVLGKDSLCYDRLANRDRKYPRGRRPLLTGGDMRAISRARRAGNRLSTAKEDLVAIGMLKPAARKRRKKRAVPVC